MQIGKYEILREIGRGGMARVYEAEDPALHRRVAIKVLREDDVSPTIVRRLHREAAIAAQLHHPNIVGIHEVGLVDATHFIVMDYVEGETLAQRLGAPLDEKLRMLEDVARAVHHAHGKGIVHRDLKPANVLVERGGRVLLTDFGLAHAESFESRLTRTNAVMGTPQYMAPEQVEGRTKEIDARTDVYALGVILYELLTSSPPFHATTAAKLYEQILREEPSRIPRADADVQTICLKAMAKDRDRRYATAEEFADDVARFRRGEPIRGRPPSVFYRIRKSLLRRRALVGAFLAVLLAAGGVYLVANREIEGTRAKLREEERLREVRERMRPVEEIIRDTRPYFYIKDVDIRAKLDQVERALRGLHGDHPDVWLLLGMGWYFVGDLRAAEEALAKAEAAGCTDGRLNFYVARIHVERFMMDLLCIGTEEPAQAERAKRHLDVALRYLQRAEGLEPVDRHLFEAYRALAERRDEDVIRLCIEGVERFKGTLGAEEYRNLAGWIEGGRNRRVQVRAYTEALEIRPHYPWAYFMRGIAHEMLKEYDEAILDYSRALEINPRFVVAWNNRGLRRKLRGDFDGALADYEAALRLDPGFVPAIANRASVKEDRGDWGGALADLNEAARLDPDFAAVYNNRGNLLRKMGKVDDAVDDFHRAIRLNPRYADAYGSRANVERERGQWEDALADYSRVIEIQPDHALAWSERATVKFALGDREAAMRDAERAVELSPGLLSARITRGVLRLQSSRPDEAIEDFEAAMKIDPKCESAYTGRGGAFLLKGRFDAAIADFDRAIELKSNEPEPWAARGQAKLAKGDKSGALADLRKALQLAPAAWLYRTQVEDLVRRLERE